MSDALNDVSRRTLTAGDRYLALLAIVLLGYALMGKGFAYIGFPPFYVGEIAFLIGIAVFLRSGVLVASIATLPAVVLVATMMWVLVRTVPFLNVYGFDALRDSVIILYGGFAFVVIGLLLEDARRIDTVIRYYRTVLVVFPAISVGFWLTKYWVEYVPKLYGPNVPVVEITGSSLGTHLAGTAVFVLVGYRKVSFLWVVVWIVTLAMLGATNRGAMLAALVPIMFAMIMLGRLRSMLITLAAGLGILGLLYAAEDTFTQYEEAKDSIERPVSAHQIVENLKSVVGQSGQQTEGTKQWRLDWWDVIINDTFHGPSFWTGRGFGLNIADEDGFAGTRSSSGSDRPLTRSPHNAFMTLLARAGVPGVVLWSLVLISWSGMMLRAMLVARARGHKQWTGLFLFITCYAMSIIINAAFDVTLEGPMQGIWFWCLFGFGIGSVMVYRAQPADGIASSGQ
jgi:O-Antigen ligase